MSALLLSALPCRPAGKLAIVDAGVEQSEDAPFASSSYEFLPGDYLYFTFQIAGFKVQSENRGEVQKISLTYDIAPQDANGVALALPSSGTIETELGSEDKDWLPKRRVSFLIPSFVAAGDFHVHVHVKDVFAEAEVSQDVPFRIGGVQIQPASTLAVQNFQFYRSEEDRDPLQVPAFSSGDTVYMRFDMVGFKTAAQNQYHLSYGLTVFRPDGKTLLNKPNASELEADSFYPPRFLPALVNLKTGPDAPRGEYVVVIAAHDLVGGASAEFKKAFSIE